MSKMVLSRRTLLRGMAAGITASIALPPLEAMFNANGTAHADGTPVPRRFATWWWAQGVGRGQWFPQVVSAQPWRQDGRQVGTFDDAWRPSPELMPLVNAGLRDQISIVTGARLFGWSETMHDSQMIGMTTGYPVTPCGGFCVRPSAPTITQVVASRFGAPSGGFDQLAATVANGNVAGVPAERSPQAMFDRVFGRTTTAGSVAPRFSAASRRSVLDLVQGEARALSARVSAADRARIDAHLESIRRLEQRIADMPPAPAVTLTRPTIARPDPDGAMPDYAGYHDAFADLMAIAFATGRTRVACMTMDAGQSHSVFWQAGAREELHGLTHPPAGDDAAFAAAVDTHHAIVTWKMQRLTRFLTALRDIPEGAGTVLDNTLVYASTEMDDPFTHYAIHQPVILAGRAGGGLRTGRYYSAFVPDPTRADGGPYTWGADATNQENGVKVLLTILRALGFSDTEFGGDGNGNAGHVTSPYGALLP